MHPHEAPEIKNSLYPQRFFMSAETTIRELQDLEKRRIKKIELTDEEKGTDSGDNLRKAKRKILRMYQRKINTMIALSYEAPFVISNIKKFMGEEENLTEDEKS
ncbi:MAG: hypothetical protein GF347_01720, partial [Candidatus Moranbacteria bacterium]|nr:hypothetical protein [Candidatus Moranbacteria bacterium]